MKFDELSYFFLEINKNENIHNELSICSDLLIKSQDIFIFISKDTKTDVNYN